MLSMQDTMAACSLWHCFAHWELLASPGLAAPTTCALAVSISMRALPPVALASPDGDEDMAPEQSASGYEGSLTLVSGAAGEGEWSERAEAKDQITTRYAARNWNGQEVGAS